MVQAVAVALLDCSLVEEIAVALVVRQAVVVAVVGSVLLADSHSQQRFLAAVAGHCSCLPSNSLSCYKTFHCIHWLVSPNAL